VHFMGVKVGVAHSRDLLAKIGKINLTLSSTCNKLFPETE